MKDKDKTKKQLMNELIEMRKRISELEETVTRCSRSEDALRKSEERFRDIADNALEWIWEVDANGKYNYANPVVEKILGYKPKEVLKKHFYDLFHPEDRKELKKAAFKVFAQKQPFREFINRNVHKNGKTVWLSTSGVPVLDGRGILLGYRGADIDITERKQAEEMLKESEENYRLHFETVSDVIFSINPKFRVLSVSPSVERTLGYKSEELNGRSFQDLNLLAPEYLKTAFSELMRVLAGERIASSVYEFVAKDGTRKFGEVSGAPLVRDGKVVAAICVARDITDRKQAEEELRISATIDALTGVLNRRFGLLLFSKQLQLSKRNSSKLSICYLDVDDLKKINDTYGHQEGDEVLKLVSKFLKETLREADITCRLGGDEFLIIFPQCSVDKAIGVWERIAKKVAAFNARKMKPYIIRLSRGFAEYDSTVGKSVDQLIAIADQDMYRDKHSRPAD